MSVPRGIDVLIKKASVDPEFRALLIEKRGVAAAEIGLELSASETAVLKAIPAAQIEQIIENTSVPKEHRRVFLGKVGAAMLAVVGLISLGSCERVSVETGIRSDEPPASDKKPTDNDTQVPDSNKQPQKHGPDSQRIDPKSENMGTAE